MSLKCHNWAWSVSTISAKQKLVLLTLADHANDRATCFPPQTRIAAKTNQSLSTVKRRLAELERSGLIKRRLRSTANPGSDYPLTEYTLVATPWAAEGISRPTWYRHRKKAAHRCTAGVRLGETPFVATAARLSNDINGRGGVVETNETLLSQNETREAPQRIEVIKEIETTCQNDPNHRSTVTYESTESSKDRSTVETQAEKVPELSLSHRNWKLPTRWREAAKARGLAAQTISAEAYRFRKFHIGKGNKAAGLNAWTNWISNLGRSPTAARSDSAPAPTATSPKFYYAKFDSPQLRHWDAHWLKIKGNLPPRDWGGGWFFESEWPPGYKPAPTPEPVTTEDRRAAVARMMERARARQAGQITGHHAPAPVWQAPY